MSPWSQDESRWDEEWTGAPVAVLWDQSLLWGLICIESLQELGVPFRLLSAREIAGGALSGFRVLVVPGGWAAHKMAALGETGRARIRHFVETGGSYLGFCGGAGLALSSPPSLALVPLKRMSLAERLPSASGEIWVQGMPDHPIWRHLPPVLPVCIWWPSQFLTKAAVGYHALATYAAPGADFWVADLAFSDVTGANVPWPEWERIYGINLDPAKLVGHPAIVEVRSGKGRLILSYPHLDTPGHAWGKRLFLSTLRYLDAAAAQILSGKPTVPENRDERGGFPGLQTLRNLRVAKAAADDLIAFGERHLFWKWRLPWLLNWRRGIRGLEYGTLAVVTTRLLEQGLKMKGPSPDADDPWSEATCQIKEEVASFCGLAKSLLLEEKLATQTRNLTKLGKVNATVDRLRAVLFGAKMNHGGACRKLFDRLDGLLLEMFRW